MIIEAIVHDASITIPVTDVFRADLGAINAKIEELAVSKDPTFQHSMCGDSFQQ